MAITLMQININSWKRNKYLLELSAWELQASIILINELNCDKSTSIKLNGYKILTKSISQKSGVAIAIRYNITFSEIPIKDPNSLAIKINTSLGPLIIMTSYIPPRINYIPIIEINKLLNYNLPFIMAGDYNAHHDFFNNTSNSTKNDNKGISLYHLIKNRNLNFLGPDFKTFKTKNTTGKPDLIIGNHHLNLFHLNITQGKNLGSDHLPVAIKIQTTPFKIVKTTPKRNLKKINITKYKEILRSIEFNSIDKQPVIEMDNLTNKIFDIIIQATEKSCPMNKIITIQSYKPTKEIIAKLQALRTAYEQYYLYGTPQIYTINHLKNVLNNLILQSKTEYWDKLVKCAVDSYGNPEKFWRKTKQYLGKGSETRKPLIKQYEISDSEDSDFGETINETLIDEQEQANFISETWQKIYKPNNEPRFKNSNTKEVSEWYNNILPNLKHDEYINLSKLEPEHPLLRPIERSEYTSAIKKQKPKTPGLSSISIIQLLHLPSNVSNAVIGLFDAIIATKYYPKLLLFIKMIFINKPNKNHTDPLNYRPISLVEVITKTFEHIIANRYKYYLEHNNILNEYQFGFRKFRSTQHAITLITETYKENCKQNYASLIATRDISKAFDTVWIKGLTYKIYNYTNKDIEFTKLIHSYCTNRTITPYFNNKVGQSFNPKAGVPQGSVIGPLLFLIYVNDIPKPIYSDTIRSQYADDLITLSKSSYKSKYKLEDVKNKLNKELQLIENWECNWKIKANPDKCNIGANWHHIPKLEDIGNLMINNTSVQYKNEVKILGYSFNLSHNATSHVTTICNKANNNLKRLFRFSSAPPKIKRILYMALIRPIIEYPCVQLSNSGKTNQRKLQRIQNKATRYITNSRLIDRKTSKSLHENSKLIPMNLRLNKLKHKTITKINLTYYPDDNQFPEYINESSSHIINQEPIYPKGTTIAKTIISRIFTNKDSCPWYQLKECPTIDPIYR